MGSTFSKHPTSLLRRSEKERLLFIAAAGLAFSLLVIMLVILNYKRDAIASQASTPAHQAVPVPMGTVTLFVPDREVSAGTKLADVNFKEVYWPRNQVPPNAVLDLAEIKNQYAKVNLPASLPVQRQSLTTTAGRAGLPVTPGNRAVTIEVDASTSIEGYTTPGSIVDVVLTYYQDGNLTSNVIVQNARVLSLGGDQTPGQQRRPGAAIANSTITLDVSPENALKIQTARQMGRISLMLRSDGDNKTSQTTSVTFQDLGNKESKKQGKGPCTRGTVKMGDASYTINCDGSMVQLQE